MRTQKKERMQERKKERKKEEEESKWLPSTSWWNEGGIKPKKATNEQTQNMSQKCVTNVKVRKSLFSFGL